MGGWVGGWILFTSGSTQRAAAGADDDGGGGGGGGDPSASAVDAAAAALESRARGEGNAGGPVNRARHAPSIKTTRLKLFLLKPAED